MSIVRVFTGLLFVVAFVGHAHAAAPAFEAQFEPATGVFRFELHAIEAADGSLTLPPLSFNGKRQAGFEPVRGRPNTWENDVLSVKWTQAAPRAVAITWSVRERVPGEFAVRITDNSNYYGGGERFQALNQKGFILPMASQDHPEAKGTATYKPVPFYMSSRGYGV